MSMTESKIMKMYENKRAFVEKNGGQYFKMEDGNILTVVLEETEQDDSRWVSIVGGNSIEEYMITDENELICVTMNSISAIEDEMMRGRSATGWMGVVRCAWYSPTSTEVI